jgi:hypothetical protein
MLKSAVNRVLVLVSTLFSLLAKFTAFSGRLGAWFFAALLEVRTAGSAVASVLPGVRGKSRTLAVFHFRRLVPAAVVFALMNRLLKVGLGSTALFFGHGLVVGVVLLLGQ